MSGREKAADQTEETNGLAISRAAGFALIGSFIILLAGAMYFARIIFLPVVLALLVSLTFTPLVRNLSRRGVPAVASATLLVLILALLLAGAGIVLAGPITDLVADAPRIIERLRVRFDEIRGPLSRLAEAGRQIQEIAQGGGEAAAPSVVLRQPGASWLAWGAGAISGIGGLLVGTLILVVFILSSSDLLLRKVIHAMPKLGDKKRSLTIVHEVENEVSRYLATITIINIGLGCAVGAAMALLGMSYPVVWGFAAALLNYIPYVGAVVATVAAAAIASITFPTLFEAALPPIAYLALQAIETTIVTPLVVGRRMSLNPVAILIALALFGWMWGVFGAVIAVPLLVVIKVFCDHIPTLATFGEFLSGDRPSLEPPAENGNGAATAQGDGKSG